MWGADFGGLAYLLVCLSESVAADRRKGKQENGKGYLTLYRLKYESMKIIILRKTANGI